MNKLTELAKQFLAFNVERDKYNDEEDYDAAWFAECNQREVGTELAELILAEEPELDDGIRICDHCGSTMTEGYCWDFGYACSDECLFVDGYTPEQYAIDYEEGSIYYTQWEPES